VQPEEPSSTLRALITYVLHQPTHFPMAHPAYELSQLQESRLNDLFAQLLDGTPLPYLTGSRSFFGLDFFVTPHVLIPRPETEMMVSAALDFLKTRGAYPVAVDVGTGSGCVAVTMAKFHSTLKVLAVDISYEAILVARKNAKRHQREEAITFCVGDLLGAIHQSFDCVCANLPYIPSTRLPDLSVSKYEPSIALDGGLNGFEFIQRLLYQAVNHLKPGGGLFLEIDHTQANYFTHFARLLFSTSSIKIEKDYAGQSRLAILIKP